jgi:hypothetical protein
MPEAQGRLKQKPDLGEDGQINPEPEKRYLFKVITRVGNLVKTDSECG